MARENRYVTTEDFRIAARRRLPRLFADYIEGGAFSETTLERNRMDFDRWAFAQRVMIDLEETDLSSEYLGSHQTLPFFPGPVGFLGVFRRDGDRIIGEAAKAAGIPFGLSTFSINGLDTLSPVLGDSLMFQLYLDRDPEVNEAYLEACLRHGVKTILLTVDTAITSVRERDNRNGFRTVDRITPRLAWQFAQAPAWALSMLRGGFPQVEMVAGRPEFGRGALAQAAALSSRLDKHLTWEKLAWLRDRWPGRLLVKGICDPRDAAIARDSGIEGIVLSNHGGRQLDHGSSTISRLPEIRAALGPGMELLIDSGFRRGSDVVKALALGADGVAMGRAFAWAVAAEGRWGVERLIALLSAEVAITLQLMGLSSVKALKSADPAEILIDLRG